MMITLLVCATLPEPAACAVTSCQESARHADLEAYTELLRESTAPRKKETRFSDLPRARIIRQTAKTYGFQKAFQHRYKALMREVDAHAMDFAKIFDFHSLLIEGKVLPPVIRSAGPMTEVLSDTLASSVQATFLIVSPARLVSSAPSYMSYLTAETEVVEPDPLSFPRNGKERALWAQALREGWLEGLAHALEVFDLSMRTLVADFRGILLFRLLERQGYVSGPVLAKGELKVQVGARILRLDEQLFRLTVPASFRSLGE